MKKLTKTISAIMLIASIVGFVGCKSTNVSNGRNHTHEYVDLGLPSGTLWATCNIGADKPEDYGDYFAWGETAPKSIYNGDTYKYCNGGDGWGTLTKYCHYSGYGYNGFSDTLVVLQPSDDAAITNWGNDWCMPTKEQWQELYQNTTNIWTIQNGANGRLFTASNGNSLFLPAAGHRWDNEFYDIGSEGDYWSSSYSFGNPSEAWDFYFNSDSCDMYSSLYRSGGSSVRAVRSSRQK